MPYARTARLDKPGDPIKTVLYADGLKRVVQTKKDITLFDGANRVSAWRRHLEQR